MGFVKKCWFKIPEQWQTLLGLNACSLQWKMCCTTRSRPNANLSRWKRFTKQHSKFCKMCFCIRLKFTHLHPKWGFCFIFTDSDLVVCASVIVFMHVTYCPYLILLWSPQRVVNVRTCRALLYGILLIFTLSTKFFWTLYLQTSSMCSVHCSRPHWDMKPAAAD
jgi:hypothetical protein